MSSFAISGDMSPRVRGMQPVVISRNLRQTESSHRELKPELAFEFAAKATEVLANPICTTLLGVSVREACRMPPRSIPADSLPDHGLPIPSYQATPIHKSTKKSRGRESLIGRQPSRDPPRRE